MNATTVTIAVRRHDGSTLSTRTAVVTRRSKVSVEVLIAGHDRPKRFRLDAHARARRVSIAAADVAAIESLPLGETDAGRAWSGGAR